MQHKQMNMHNSQSLMQIKNSLNKTQFNISIDIRNNPESARMKTEPQISHRSNIRSLQTQPYHNSRIGKINMSQFKQNNDSIDRLVTDLSQGQEKSKYVGILNEEKPSLLVSEIKKLEHNMSIVNNNNEKWYDKQMSPRYYVTKKQKRREENLKKYLLLEKNLEQHLYLSEEHMLIVDGREDQMTLIKCDIKGKLFPLHLRLKSKMCQINVYYSSFIREPAKSKCNKHFIIERDQVIKITESDNINGEYVYFALHFDSKTRLPVSCWFDKPKLVNQTKLQLEENKNLIEDFEKRTGLVIGRSRSNYKNWSPPHTDEEIKFTVKIKRLNLKKLYENKNYINNNIEQITSFNQRNVEQSHIRQITARDKSTRAKNLVNIYDHQDRIYNLSNYLMKHTLNMKKRYPRFDTRQSTLQNIQVKLKWQPIIILLTIMSKINKILVIIEINQALSEKQNTNYTRLKIIDCGGNDCQIIIEFSLLIPSQEKMSYLSEKVCYLIHCQNKQKEIFIRIEEQSHSLLSKRLQNNLIEVIQIQRFFKTSLKYDTDQIHLMINRYIKEIQELKETDSILASSQVKRQINAKQLSIEMREEIALQYLSEIMSRYKLKFHKYYKYRNKQEKVVPRKYLSIDFSSLVKKVVEQIVKDEQISDIQKSIKKRQSILGGPLVQTQNDLITERLEKKRRTLMCEMIQVISPVRQKNKPPHLKLFKQKDYLMELVDEKLDYLRSIKR